MEKCTKPELLLIAKVFKIDVAPGANRAEVKHCVEAKLAAQGLIMSEGTQSQGAAAIPLGESQASAIYSAEGSSPTPANVAEGDSLESLGLALRLRETVTVELDRTPAPPARSPPTSGNETASSFPATEVDTLSLSTWHWFLTLRRRTLTHTLRRLNALPPLLSGPETCGVSCCNVN